MPHRRPGSVDSFEDNERDYENVQPSQPPFQHEMKPQWPATAEPAISTLKSVEQSNYRRKSLGVLYTLLGVFLLISITTFVLVLLKWIPCCPGGWEQFQQKCYFFSSNETAWDEAKKSCLQFGAQLVIIHSQRKQTFLSGGIGASHHWIGLSYKDTEEWWTWVDSSPLSHISWSAGSLPVNSTQKRCVYLTGHAGGEWKDEDCETHYSFICERAGPFCS
ncbi:CD209 antigen-like protein 2 [Carettochelys insculpta]|uniref:CD209 antigen-like protein 2 n=1 Tax=Carettochelys insculpta TaxID=44489 RepID=UPI003EBFE2BD